LPGTYLGD
jgi:hypothetical protein